MIIALPLLVIALFAAMQFAVLVIVQGAVTQAAIVAARETGKGASNAAIQQAVNAVLSVHQIALGPNASVVIQRPSQPNVQIGTFPCGPIAGPALGPKDVRATMCVDLTTPPLLNTLTSFGLDFSGGRIQISAVSPIE